MHGFRLLWENAISHNPRDAIFGFDHTADVNAARLAARLFSNTTLSERQAGQLGMVMHYGLGATLGITYAWRPADSGVLFGVLLWLCADEIPISLSGISDPFGKSPASHASALTAHVVFGYVTAQAVRAMQSEQSVWLSERERPVQPKRGFSSDRL
jgi:hypothetical protein